MKFGLEALLDTMRRILIVDPDPTALAVIADYLHDDDTRITRCQLAESAIDLLARVPFDVVITDLCLGEAGSTSAIDLILHVKRHHPAVVVVVFSAPSGDESARACLAAGASALLTRPHDLKALRALLAVGGANRG